MWGCFMVIIEFPFPTPMIIILTFNVLKLSNYGLEIGDNPHSFTQVASLRENALHIIKVFPSVFGDKLQHYTGVARQLFWQTLNDTEPMVQQAAAMAVCSFIENLTAHTWKPFQELLPIMLLIIERAIIAQEDTSLLKV